MFDDMDEVLLESVNSDNAIVEDTTALSRLKTVQAQISHETLNLLNEMRENCMLTDGIVTVTDASFNIHRAILSSCSPYFRVQFTGFNNGSLSSTQEEQNRNIHIPGISGKIMEQILQYAYIRRCTIDEDNVHELLTTADYFGMIGLVSHCKEFLASIISPENCISIMAFARFRFLDDLYEKAHTYIMKNFTEIAAKNQDITEIGLKDFYDIVSDDELNIKDELIIWKLCVKWIDYDVQNRKCHLPQLMKAVRFGLLAPQIFMDEVKDHPYVTQCDEVRPIIIETLTFMYALDAINPLDEREVTTPSIAIPRLPHEVIFAIGGWSGGASKGCIETYDTRADRWISINAEDPAGPRAYHGTAVIGFKIYCIGGYDGIVYFNTCRVFDAVQKTWHEIAPMHTRRCYVAVAQLNGFIYAMGGFDGSSRLNTVERYNPKTNQWSFITPMAKQRSDASACSLRGRIYVTGGFNGTECLDSVEVYNEKRNVWTRAPNMSHRRSGVSCVAYKNLLYVIGGFNGVARLSTGERYDPDTGKWSFIMEMTHARSNFGLEIIDDMIFAIGGFNGVSTIAHTECYVAENDEWMEATDMNLVRSALSANVIESLPNKREFMHQDRHRLMEERRQRLFPSAIAEESEAAIEGEPMEEDNVEFDVPADVEAEPEVAAEAEDIHQALAQVRAEARRMRFHDWRLNLVQFRRQG